MYHNAKLAEKQILDSRERLEYVLDNRHVFEKMKLVREEHTMPGDIIGYLAVLNPELQRSRYVSIVIE